MGAPSSAEDDAELVSRVQSGEQDAFAELVRRNHAWVLGLCAATLADRSAADDASQEVFLKAYKSLPRFKSGSSFSTWLHRIAVNHCFDLLRSRARRKTESWDELLEKEGERIHLLLAAPAQAGHSPEDADLVRRVLDCLPPDYRLVLTLREVQGLSYDEIAAAMDCSLDSVKARLQRARRDFTERLRHFLDPLSV
ncbi:MAG: sigma-70 family RNA polymerase sigma factor [Elusimicrobia bacterium]|nr:sigma-70 family RNA polymerase sigma factor [Elusimicrobiota bacterium]